MAAAEKFKAPEPAAPMDDTGNAKAPTIAEESEEEEVGSCAIYYWCSDLLLLIYLDMNMVK